MNINPRPSLVFLFFFVLSLFICTRGFAADTTQDFTGAATPSIPDRFLPYVNTAMWVWFLLSRAYKNLKAGDGLYGIWTGIFWGDKTPDAKIRDDARRTEVINR